MTVKEAKDYLNKLDKQCDDYHLVIPTQGLSCSRIGVKSFAAGFDWFNGCICINAEKEPSQIDNKKYSKICKLYLMQKSISNLRDIINSKTLVAKYKKLEKSFERQHQAELWIWGKLEEELNNL